MLKKEKIYILSIIIVTALTYVNSLNNGFVGDDSAVIVDNNFVKSWKNFPAVFTRSYLSTVSKIRYSANYNDIGSGELSYRPMVTISYFIDYSLWRLDPFGYHLSSLSLHIFNAILLYLLINLICRDKKTALLASLLFALHPVNTETVNDISSREDLLAFLFFISSFILYVKLNSYTGRKKRYTYFGSIILFIFALFSKESSVTLPLLLILYDYYLVYNRKAGEVYANCKLRYSGYFACLLFYLWVLFFPMANTAQVSAGYPGGSFYANLLSMLRVMAAYIRWLLVPAGIHLTIHDPQLFSYSFFEPGVLLSALVLIICLVVAVKIRRVSEEIPFALLWFPVTLLPVSNIWPIKNILAARYLYIPSAAFCFVAAILLNKLSSSKAFSIRPQTLEKLARGAVIAILLLYSLITITRNYTFRNNITLWSEIVTNYPGNTYAHRQLGLSFMKNGFTDKAIGEYKKAIDLSPDNAMAHFNLADSYFNKGMLDEAVRQYEKALGLDPNLIHAHNNLGYVLMMKKSYHEAIDCFRRAIRINPYFTEGYNNLGVAYANMKKWNQAKEAWQKTLSIDPENKKARNELYRLATK